MAPSSRKIDILDMDISFDIERLFDHYNFDHIPTDKRLQLFKQRDLPHVKHYKAAVKIFGGPNSRTRAIIAPPMETPLKHRLGVYVNVIKTPDAPILNGTLKPPAEPVKLQTKEEIALKEEEVHVTHYNSIIAKRKQLRKDLDGLILNEAYLERKKDKSELEKRVQAKFRADRIWKPQIDPSVEIVPSSEPPPDVPAMAVPPPGGLQILDRFLSLNNMRLIDLFLTADKDKSWSLSRQEFLNVVTKAEIPMTESEVDAMIITLDADLDDTLTYKELNKGLQLWRKLRRVIKNQSEEAKKKCFNVDSTSKEHHAKLASTKENRDSRTTLKEQSEINKDKRLRSNDQIKENIDSKSERKKHYQENRLFLPDTKQKDKGVSVPICNASIEKRSAKSSSILATQNNAKRSLSGNADSKIITATNSKLNLSFKLDFSNDTSDSELSTNYSTDDGQRLSEDLLHISDKAKTSMPQGEARVHALNTTSSNAFVSGENVLQVSNTRDILVLDGENDRCMTDGLVLQSKEIEPSTATYESSDEEIIKTLDRQDTSKETRPQSHKASTCSHTSTPNSLEPPETYLQEKAWMPASIEEMMDIRKHDRVVLSRSKIRRRLPREKRAAFDTLPGVIKIGYKPIDDHCSESTLEGNAAEMVNQFRQEKLKEYFDVKKMFEDMGLMFSQKSLDRVLLYPGDRPTVGLGKNIAMPVGPLTNEQSAFMKLKRIKSSAKWQRDERQLLQHNRKSGTSNVPGKGRTRSVGGASRGTGTGISQRRAQESDQRSRRRPNRGYLTVEEVYPHASTHKAKVYSENLSSGRALISRKVDTWMTFEEYSKYTQNLPNRFRHINNKSNPDAVWPGFLLDKLRLYMDSDLILADGYGRPLKNRDSQDYEGFGTGMYNGRGNALFRHTGQPKRAYPGYNNDLLTWPVGEAGVRYGNIDEHRLVK